MNRPAVPAAGTPSGWQDQRLSQAYELIAAVQKDCGIAATKTPIREQLGAALDAIELGDGLLVLAARQALGRTA